MLAIYSTRRIFAARAIRLVAAAASTLLLTSAITFIQPGDSAAAADCATSTTTFVGDGNNGTVNGATYNLAAIKSGSNCTWTTPDGIRAVSFLTIGGGGGGASRHGGGGSAGEYLVTSRTVDVAAQITVSVGAGGAGEAKPSAVCPDPYLQRLSAAAPCESHGRGRRDRRLASGAGGILAGLAVRGDCRRRHGGGQLA